MKRILFYLFMFFITSCGRKYNHKIEYFPNKRIKTEYDTTAAGKVNGICKDYFVSGKIHLIRTYFNGKLNGKCIEYYKNGKLKNEASFTLDKPNGWFVDYDSTGIIFRKEESVLIYKNMFNAESSKFLENDTVNLSHKEDYINNSYYYKNSKLLRDSSYFCTIEFKNISEKINIGDSIYIILKIPCKYFASDGGKTDFMLRIEDSNNNKVIIKKNFKNKPSYITVLFNVSLKPNKKGVGCIYGVIKEVNSKKESHDYFFRKNYFVE
jgi:hypothetical protein